LTFEPESLVLSSGDIPQKLYLLRRGRAILIKERELRYDFVTPVEPGCIYGMVEALSGDSFEYSMKTVTQCDFGVIDKDNFLGRMSNDPVMCFRLAQTMGRLNRKILLSLTTD
jgi:CRP-like cAMP-binding protein